MAPEQHVNASDNAAEAGSVAASLPVREQHDFDPVTWRCRRCTVMASSGIVRCDPPEGWSDDDAT